MNYIANTIWKHEKPLNEDEQRAYLETVKTVLDEDGSWIENYWFKIDDYTHGSVSIYSSEEAWERLKDKIAAQRSFSTGDRGVTMLAEYNGPAFAVLSEVG